MNRFRNFLRYYLRLFKPQVLNIIKLFKTLSSLYVFMLHVRLSSSPDVSGFPVTKSLVFCGSVVLNIVYLFVYYPLAIVLSVIRRLPLWYFNFFPVYIHGNQMFFSCIYTWKLNVFFLYIYMEIKWFFPAYIHGN